MKLEEIDSETLRQRVKELLSKKQDAQPKGDFLVENAVASMFVDCHTRELLYVDLWGRWLLWKDGRWQHDETRAVDLLARALTRKILIEAVDGDRQDKIKDALKLQKRSAVDALVALARSDARVARHPSDFDRDHWLLNCKNGTLDLRTGVIHEHRQEDHITKSSPVEYRPEAECPAWESFLEEIMPDPALRAYVKRAAGYSLTGSVEEQVFFFAHGGGANGKSVFLAVLEYICGNYGKTAAPELLLVKTHDKHETELADLAGVRLLTTIETESGRRLAESRTKMLTGGDRIKARFLYRDFFEFQPTFKLWLASNHKPPVLGTDYAIWRRIHLIPFTVTIPPERQDKKLFEKLKVEAPGILRWAIEGCLEWQRDGLQPPECVLRAVREYREEQDTIGLFLAECCLTGPALYDTAKRLYDRYTKWCEEAGEKPVSKKTFGQALTERGFEGTHTKIGSVWRGLILRPKDLDPEKCDADHKRCEVTDGDANSETSFTRARSDFSENASPSVTVTECDVDHTFCPRCNEPISKGERLCAFCLETEALERGGLQ